MNFLADESCAGPVVRTLREAGHDVVAIAEANSPFSSQRLRAGLKYVAPTALEETRMLPSPPSAYALG